MDRTKTQSFDILECEYKRRVKSLNDDGYRVVFDTSNGSWSYLWVAFLIHTNGNKIRVFYNRQNGHLWQTTNGTRVYDNREQKMC